MTIIWKNNMRIGCKTIDNEHKYLFSLTNCVLLSVKLGDIELVEVFVDQLVEYTSEHFSHEEKIQALMDYPKMTQHQLEHKKIVQGLLVLKEELHRTNIQAREGNQNLNFNDVDKLKGMFNEVSALLRSWILEHVLTSDLKMKDYILSLPKEKRPH